MFLLNTVESRTHSDRAVARCEQHRLGAASTLVNTQHLYAEGRRGGSALDPDKARSRGLGKEPHAKGKWPFFV